MLLLGASYGDPVFDTGLSPTEEEWNTARRRGIPILAFRKRAVEMEPRQEEFARRVEEYTGGRFRVTFDGPVDLQPQVVRVIAELATRGQPLVWGPLDQPVQAPWIQDLEEIRGIVSGGAVLECHLVAPGAARRIQAKDLEPLSGTRARLGREHRLFAAGEGLDVGIDAERAWAMAAPGGSTLRRGVQVRREGTVSVWTELPIRTGSRYSTTS